MKRRRNHLASTLFLLALSFVAAGALRAAEEPPLVQRATPDPARQARRAVWLDRFGEQAPALREALAALDRERANWHASTDPERCRHARRALAEVDRGELLWVSDYPLVSAIGSALDELDGAVRACLDRRYFELDYRLGLARQALARARDVARARPRE